MGGLNMRLHIILNMPAVLSIHKDWKARERERQRERKREGRREEKCGSGNPQEAPRGEAPR
jgi:hypothetical protein